MSRFGGLEESDEYRLSVEAVVWAVSLVLGGFCEGAGWILVWISRELALEGGCGLVCDVESRRIEVRDWGCC